MNNVQIKEKLDDCLNNYINEYPLKDISSLTYYKEATQFMNKHVWTPIHITKPTSDPMAFVKKSGGYDGVYEVYVNPYVDDETKKCFLLHEFGHVIFSHMELPMIQEEFLMNKIWQFWPVLGPYFDSNSVLPQTIIQDIASSFINIAQDFEVNSKLFTEEEWEKFQYNSQISYMNALLHSSECNTRDKLQILEWFQTKEDKRNPVFAGFHPKDFNFPCKLNYTQYIDLILQTPDLFFSQLSSILSSSFYRFITQNLNPKLLPSDFENLNKQIDDKHQPEKGEITVVDDPEALWNGLQGYSKNGKAKLRKKQNHCLDIENTASQKKLENFILQHCYSKSIKNVRNDSMYYYNRRKYNTNIFISKSREEELYHPGSIYLLIDCSGSINYEAIKIMIKIVQNIARKLEQHSRIIWWYTELAGDYPLTKLQPPAGSGGTCISTGINYVRQKYLKHSNDKLIIISDYYDNLKAWYDELVRIKNDCIGIRWSYNDDSILNQDLFDSCYEEVTTGKLESVLPTTLVKI